MRFAVMIALLLSILSPMPVMAQIEDPMAPETIARNALSMPPAQRQVYLDAYKKLSAEQKDQISRQAKEAWKYMTPEQKKALEAEAVRQWQGMSAQDQEALAQQASDKWNTLSPQQKEELKSDFQQFLKGKLEPAGTR